MQLHYFLYSTEGAIEHGLDYDLEKTIGLNRTVMPWLWYLESNLA